MASRSSLSEADFYCPVCYEIFKNPVVLSCSHSLCKGCLQKWWRGKAANECPLCRKVQARPPPCNLAVKNLCDILMERTRPKRSLREEVRNTWTVVREKLEAKLSALRRRPGGVPRRSLRDRFRRFMYFYKRKRRLGRFASVRYNDF